MDWLGIPWPDVARILASGVLVMLGLLAYARIVGLRSFTKMSTLDFATTVAVGSVLGTATLSVKTPVAAGVVALGILMVFPWGINALRRNSEPFRRVVDNRPTLLMLDGEILSENLDRNQVALDDLRAKLREANVLRLSEVRAVVLETTGDISVLHGDVELDDWLLDGVNRQERHVVGGD